ncbi:MAG: LysR family transcriptional regulator [Agarilytica sp.]
MRYEDFNLELIRCFITVAELQSFTEAGERLHKSQSAISVRIKKLEDLLGHVLFDRTSRKVELSEQGQRFLPYALKLLHLNEAAIGALQASDLRGVLRIGVVEYFAAHRLPGLVAEIARLYPSVDLRVRLALSSELFTALDANEVDVIIAKHDDMRPGGTPVLSESLHWVHCMDDGDIEAQEILPLCVLPKPCIYRAHALDALKGRPWRESVISGSVLGVQSAVMAGLGVGVLGESCVLPEMRRLSEKDGFPKLPKVILKLYGPERETSKLVKPVVRHLCQQLSD